MAVIRREELEDDDIDLAPHESDYPETMTQTGLTWELAPTQTGLIDLVGGFFECIQINYLLFIPILFMQIFREYYFSTTTSTLTLFTLSPLQPSPLTHDHLSHNRLFSVNQICVNCECHHS